MTFGVAESSVACGRFEGEKASVDLLTVLDPPPLYQAGTFAAGATPRRQCRRSDRIPGYPVEGGEALAKRTFRRSNLPPIAQRRRGWVLG